MDERPHIPTENTSSRRQSDGRVGFWTFAGLLLLFSVPVIGWIAALIFLLGSKNRTVRIFSGAHLTVTAVSLTVLLLTFSLLLSPLLEKFLPLVKNTLKPGAEIPSDPYETMEEPLGTDYSDAIQRFIPVITSVLGSEIKPFLTELSSGKYEKLLRQLKNEEYGLILADIENGEYPELEKTLDPVTYGFLLGELRKEAKGQDSFLFEKLEELLP